MRYYKYTIETERENEEAVTAMLYARDIASVEIEDDEVFADAFTGEIYPELQPDARPHSGARISFYREDRLTDGERAELEREISAKLSESIVDDAEWKDKWKEYFHAFTVDGIHIRPTWEEGDDPDADCEIVIDPGMSFGTGQHESTQLILRQMRRYLKQGDRVLDVGCGSGILSIAASRLGAAEVSGVDIDPDCITSTYDNLEANNADIGDGSFYAGDIGNDPALREKIGYGCYNLVFANILADIIIDLAPHLWETLCDGGVLITSGIIDFKEAEVADALTSRGFTIIDTHSMGEWRSIACRK